MYPTKTREKFQNNDNFTRGIPKGISQEEVGGDGIFKNTKRFVSGTW